MTSLDNPIVLGKIFYLSAQLDDDLLWTKNGGIETAMNSPTLVSQGSVYRIFGFLGRLLGFTADEQLIFFSVYSLGGQRVAHQQAPKGFNALSYRYAS